MAGGARAVQNLAGDDGQVGLRRVEVAGRQLRVNQRPILLKGVNRHEHDERRGKAVTEEGMQRDVQLLKQFNFNSVRCAHYPNHPRWRVPPLASRHNQREGTCASSSSASCWGRKPLRCASNKSILPDALLTALLHGPWLTSNASPARSVAASDRSPRSITGYANKGSLAGLGQMRARAAGTSCATSTASTSWTRPTTRRTALTRA